MGYLVGSIQEKVGIRPSYIEGLKAHENRTYQEYIKTEDDYCRLARKVVEHQVITGNRYSIDPNTDYYAIESGAKGCFVSIKNASGLRGCIGTIYPSRNNLIEEIIDNAIKAATGDPRFERIEEEELEGLIISVDVLMAPERVVDMGHLDPRRYGVIVTAGLKKGLLLPDLEGVDTVEEQIRIAKSKADIHDEPYVIDRFEVIRHQGMWGQ